MRRRNRKHIREWGLCPRCNAPLILINNYEDFKQIRCSIKYSCYNVCFDFLYKDYVDEEFYCAPFRINRSTYNFTSIFDGIRYYHFDFIIPINSTKEEIQQLILFL